MARWNPNTRQNFSGFRPAFSSGNGQGRKRSGVNRSGKSPNGNAYISAWKVERRAGLIGIFATQTKNCKTKTLRNGKTYLTMRVEVKQGFNKSITFGYWNDQGRYLLIPEFGLQVNVARGFVSRMNKR